MEKKRRLKQNSPSVILSFERKGTIPTWKGTVAVLGMAKRGPIQRYKLVVKNTEKPSPTNFAISVKLDVLLTDIATTDRSGRPTPVIQNPQAALTISIPAFCPMDTGNIRFPAPKSIPKNMDATTIISLKLIFFSMIQSLICFLGNPRSAHPTAGTHDHTGILPYNIKKASDSYISLRV